MNFSKKRAGLFILILLVIFMIGAVIVKKSGSEKIIQGGKEVQDIHEQKPAITDSSVKAERKVKFKSNDEIKKEYGKIETVYLWNGKTYTGAVVNTNELYTIVTVGGVFKIPMNDVKLREIIR